MSAPYLGDFNEDQEVVFYWNTNDGDGASITRATDGTIKVRRDDGTDCTGGSVTDNEDTPDTGIHECKIATTDSANFAVGYDYTVWVDGTVIDGETVNAAIACFSIENRFQEVDVVKWLGQACAAVTVNGVPEVDLTHLGGVAQSATDLKDFADTGYNPTTHVAQADLMYILAHLLTQTGTQLADGFEHFFDVGTPTGTVDSLPAAVPGAAGGVFIAGTNAETTVTTAINANIIGDITGTLDTVTTCTTTTTNSDMVGTNGANTTVPDAAGVVAGLLGTLETHGDAAWATGTGTSTLTQADVRTAVGLASANLDTQLGAIPTTMRGTDNAALAATALTDVTWTDAKAAFLDASIAAIPTTAMRGTDNAALAATALTDVTWTDAKAAFLDASIAAIPTTAMRGTDSAALATTALSTVVWTNTKAGYIDASIAAIPTTAMRGTDNAALATTALTNVTWTDAKAGYLTGNSYTRLGSPAGASVSADVAAVKTDTGNIASRITAALFSGITSLASWLGLLAGKTADAGTLAEIQATTAGATFTNTTDSLEAIADGGGGGGATAQQVWEYAARALTDKAGFSLSTAGVDAVWDKEIETGTNAHQALALIGAATGGKLSGADGTTITICGLGVDTTRIVATVDVYGNRSALTLTRPS